MYDPVPDQTPPSIEDTNRQIVSTVRALIASRGLQPADVADKISMGRSTLYKRLSRQTMFTAAEVARLAWYFQVPVSDLYDGLGGRLAGSRAGIRSDTSRYRSAAQFPVRKLSASVTDIADAPTRRKSDKIADLRPFRPWAVERVAIFATATA